MRLGVAFHRISGHRPPVDHVPVRTPLLLGVLVVLMLGVTGCVVQPIAAGDAPPTPYVEYSTVPVIAVAPLSAAPGDTVFVAGAGWNPGDAVYINLLTTDEAETKEITVGVATADDESRFNASFVYPFDAPWNAPGPMEIVAYSIATGDRVSTPFEVEAEEVVTPPTPTETPAAATPTAMATPTAPENGYPAATVTSSGLNVRSGPGSGYAIVRSVSRGTQMAVLGQSADSYWLYIRLDNGVVGWVARYYTDFRGTVPIIPAPPLQATPTPTPQRWATSTPTPPVSGYEWRGEYFNNMGLQGHSVLTRFDRAVDFDWGYGSPDSRVNANYFSARWTRTVYLPAGVYRFYARSDDGVRVFVNGDRVIDEWRDASGYTFSGERSLSSGDHTIEVHFYERTQIAKVNVWWERVDAYPEWRGEYFNNRDLRGEPTFTRNDPEIQFNWGNGSPDSRINSDFFSVRWTRTLYFDDGLYRFNIRVDDGMRLFIDGRLIIDEWRVNSTRNASAEVDLSSGHHDIRVEFFENTGTAEARLSWERVDHATSFPDWKGEYWTNRHLSGSPQVVRNDRDIDFNWGNGSPSSRIPSDHFSARWTDRVRFSDGRYRFYVRSDDGVRVFINGDRIIDEWRDQKGDRTFTAERNLDGRYDVKVEYYEREGGAAIEFWWERISDATATPTPTPTITPTPTATPIIVPNPNARVRPGAGTANTVVTVLGDGFPANSTVNVYLGRLVTASRVGPNATVYATAVTDSRGAYSAIFTMPVTWPDGSAIESGDLLVLVATPDFAVSASATFSYQAPKPTVAPNPYLEIDPTSGQAGTAVTVRGGGFPANTTVNVHLGELVRASGAASAPARYASAVTDANGNFNTAFVMPNVWSSGDLIESGKIVVLAATPDFNVQASAVFDYFAARPNPSINMQPRAGSAGIAVTVNGDGFPADATLNVHLGRLDSGMAGAPEVYATTRTDQVGRYSMAFNMPATWPDGTPIQENQVVVVVATTDFSLQVSAVFNFTPAAGPTPTPTLTPTPTNTPPVPDAPKPNPFAALSPPAGGPGAVIAVSGGGFPANTTVNVHLGALDGASGASRDPGRYATTTTDGSGNYVTTFTLPATWPDGSPIETGKVVVLVATNDFQITASALFDYVQVRASMEEPPTVAPTPTATPTATPEPPTATPEPPTATPEPATATPEPATATPVEEPTEPETPEAGTSEPEEPAPAEEESGPSDAVDSSAEEPTATPEPPTATPEPPTATPEPPTATPEPPTATPEPPTATPEPPTATPEPPTATPEPPTATPEPPTATPEPPTATPEPPTATPEPPTATPEPPTATPEPPTATPEPPTATPEPPPEEQQELPPVEPSEPITQTEQL